MPVPLLIIISVPAALSIPFIIYRLSRPYYGASESARTATFYGRRPSTDSSVPSVSSSPEPRTPTPLMSPTEEGAIVWQTPMSASGRSGGRARGNSSESEEYVHFGRRIKTGLREKLGL